MGKREMDVVTIEEDSVFLVELSDRGGSVLVKDSKQIVHLILDLEGFVHLKDKMIRAVRKQSMKVRNGEYRKRQKKAKRK